MRGEKKMMNKRKGGRDRELRLNERGMGADMRRVRSVQRSWRRAEVKVKRR